MQIQGLFNTVLSIHVVRKNQKTLLALMMLMSIVPSMIYYICGHGEKNLQRE